MNTLRKGVSGRGRGRAAGILVSIGISAAILFYLAVSLDWSLLAEEFGRVDPWFLLPLIAVNLLPFWLRAVRWRYLLPTRELPPSIGQLTKIVILTQLAAFLLPLRASEFVRPWLLTRKSSVSYSGGLASVVIERVFDVLAMLALFGLAIWSKPELPAIAVLGAQSLGMLAGAISVFMLVAYIWPIRLQSICRSILQSVLLRGENGAARYRRFGEPIERIVSNFIEGLRGIRNIREVAAVVFLSLAIWFSYAFAFQVVLWAFGEYPSCMVGVMVAVMVALAVAAPSSPGFIGTLQAGCVIALSIYGYSNEFAVAFSIIAHFAQFIVALVAGLIALHLEGLTFRQLARRTS